MYYDFDFNRDSEFFAQSPTIKFIKDKIAEDKYISKLSPEIVDVSIQLWAESVIKHNLDINMTGVEHLHLISEQNSKKVLDSIGAIMFKGKSERTKEEFQTLRDQGMVNNCIQLITLSFEKDVCSDLKKEFVEFRSLNPESIKKNKP